MLNWIVMASNRRVKYLFTIKYTAQSRDRSSLNRDHHSLALKNKNLKLTSMASKGRKGQWGWYREHKFSYCHTFHYTRVKYFEKLSHFIPRVRKPPEKDQMQVLLRVDIHQASVTAGLKWAEHSQKPITAMIFIFNS